ncbi:hypothetical protein V2J09_012975 [Rumex salicifolius]
MKTVELGEGSKAAAAGMTRGISIMDMVLRIVAGVGTLASAIAMGTTNETLPFFTRFIRFQAQYDDLPSLTYVHTQIIIISHSLWWRMQLFSGGASASAAIVYLAHNGNTSANWFAICQQFNGFCERISGSLIGSFIAIAVFVILIVLSAIAISKHRS